jgi:hypothetical protein
MSAYMRGSRRAFLSTRRAAAALGGADAGKYVVAGSHSNRER